MLYSWLLQAKMSVLMFADGGDDEAIQNID